MTQSRLNPSHIINRLSRQKLLLILETALECGSTRFLRQASLLWLTSFPGDLRVNLLLARGLVMEGKPQQALPIVEKLCRLDPEFSEAQELLAHLQADRNPEVANQALANAHAVSKGVPVDVSMPAWIRLLRGARTALAGERLDEAEKMSQQLLTGQPDSILGSILQMQLASARKDTQTVVNLAQVYRTRWPDCLQFALFLAEAQLESGDEAGAVNLLHRCVVNDAAAQVPVRIWGDNFPYRPLWPEVLEIHFDMPVPAEVASRLGWNLLPDRRPVDEKQEFFTLVEPPAVDPEDANVTAPGQKRAEMPGENEPVFPFLEALVQQEEQQDIPVERVDEDDQAAAGVVEEQVYLAGQRPAEMPALDSAEGDDIGSDAEESPSAEDGQVVYETEIAKRARPKLSETAQSIGDELERVAKRLKKPGMGRGDGRYPIYVILSTEAGLVKQYGQNTLAVVDKELNRLTEIVRRRADWGALVFYPDSPACMAKYGLNPVDPTDPWKLKLALADLDQFLAKKGEMIGALLIVGGPEVIPFHHLPNPVDDLEKDIASDNPYATLDSNYFIQDWPTGRLPGETGPDSGLLLEQIRQVIRYHNRTSPAAPGQRRQSDFWQRVQVFLSNRNGKKGSFGYTAAVWRRSSLAVFRQIGEAHALLASPPQSSGGFRNGKLTSSSLAYYNLHGLPDAAEWYGQRDMLDATPGPDYPVALSPRDISGKAPMPEVVFSEACYGAHIIGKSEDQSMALKFLAQGTLAVVGSTSIAYGSVSVPLIGADLLGHYFWKYLKEGQPVGQALLQAKVDLVREMNKRQGFLDGEDQKTLISFVLYGDPLVTAVKTSTQPKGFVRLRSHPAVKTICDRAEELPASSSVSTAVIKQVKAAVAEYLPGLDQAQVNVHRQHASCEGGDHRCPTSQIHAKNNGKASADPQQMVVTIRKEVQIGARVQQQYARVTVDAKGQVVKMVLSR